MGTASTNNGAGRRTKSAQQGGGASVHNVDNDGSHSSSSASPPAKLRPPPYNLQVLCSRSSIAKDAVLYDFWLVPEDKPYEIWKPSKRIIGVNGRPIISKSDNDNGRRQEKLQNLKEEVVGSGFGRGGKNIVSTPENMGEGGEWGLISKK